MSYSKRQLDEMNRAEDESFRMTEDVYGQPEYGSDDYLRQRDEEVEDITELLESRGYSVTRIRKVNND